jgi:hypothetical protein
MSFDLCFWQETGAVDQSPEEIYARVSEEEQYEGISDLSVAKLKEEFLQLFPIIEEFSTELNWEGEEGNFQVVWPVGSKLGFTFGFIVSCSWGLVERLDKMALILRAAKNCGCTLYDPQRQAVYKDPDQWVASD